MNVNVNDHSFINNTYDKPVKSINQCTLSKQIIKPSSILPSYNTFDPFVTRKKYFPVRPLSQKGLPYPLRQVGRRFAAAASTLRVSFQSEDLGDPRRRTCTAPATTNVVMVVEFTSECRELVSFTKQFVHRPTREVADGTAAAPLRVKLLH